MVIKHYHHHHHSHRTYRNIEISATGYRKICRSCRMKRCLHIGMLPENVQNKGQRKNTIKSNNVIINLFYIYHNFNKKCYKLSSDILL
ncbi:Zinc finger C4 type (two domains) family protein [Brugia pahangi]